MPLRDEKLKSNYLNYMRKMKKISVVLMALVALFVVSCNKGSIADQTVKMLEDAVAKIQKCEKAEDVKAIATEVQEFLTANAEEIEKIGEEGPEADKMKDAMMSFVSALAEKGGLGDFLEGMVEIKKDEALDEAADAVNDAAEDVADAAKEISDAVKE